MVEYHLVKCLMLKGITHLILINVQYDRTSPFTMKSR